MKRKMTINAIRSRRSKVCYSILKEYAADEPETNLADLLADAMHWCDQTGNSFDELLERAKNHHFCEINGLD